MGFFLTTSRMNSSSSSVKEALLCECMGGLGMLILAAEYCLACSVAEEVVDSPCAGAFSSATAVAPVSSTRLLVWSGVVSIASWKRFSSSSSSFWELLALTAASASASASADAVASAPSPSP